MGMESNPENSERENDVDKAREMAAGSDWQHSQAAKVRGGAENTFTAAEWEEGANSGERLAALEYDTEKAAKSMNSEELREAVRQSREESQAERAVNPEYVIGSKLDHLTRKAVIFAKEEEARRPAGK